MTPAASALDALAARLPAYEPNAGWVVAYSGGLDSTCLLHAIRAARPDARLRAIHVDHGWHPDSARWAADCVARAALLGVACEVVRLAPAAGRGGREASARRGRQALFAAALEPGEVLLTAHHADDQAETVLLMALRGGGLPGLAAMPEVAALGAGRHVRPWLATRRATLAAWARTRGLEWVEDPSNRDLGHDRNFLRHTVLPVLEQRWPASVHTLARVAGHAADAQALLDALAAADLASVATADGALSVPALRGLERRRAANLVRYWLAQAGFEYPPARALARVFEELLPAAHDRQALVAWPGVELRRWRAALYAMRPRPALGPGPWTWDLRGACLLPDGSRLWVDPQPGPGLALVAGEPVELRLRQGGERLRLAGAQHHVTVKRLLQDLALPPWQRARIPLVFHAGQLVAVADRGVAADWTAADGLVLRWSPA